MKNLYEAANAAEAHMLVDLLKQQGITAQIHGEHLQGAMGGLPTMGLVRLVVDEQDFGPARAALDQWEKTDAATQPASPRREASAYRGLQGLVLGLALGIGGMVAAYKTPMTVDGADRNRDGLLDEKWTLGATGRAQKLELDRNLDRKMDHVAHYDLRGEIEWSESDDDFDGVFETKTRYRDGNMTYSETDTDGDRYADLRTYFKNGVVESVETIKPTTGWPLRIEYYQLGKLSHADVDADEDGKLDTRLTYTPLGEVATRQPVPTHAAR